MREHTDEDHGEFTPEAWQERYRDGHPVSGHAPSPVLVDVARALVSGRALDAGCGRGANALWLAGHGWQVTGVDVSDVALADAAQAAAARGLEAAWVRADLDEWAPPVGAFDLVTCLYVHLPGPFRALVGRLAAAVAPGGTLLVVGHAAHGSHDRPAGADVSVAEVVAGLPEAGWDVLRAAPHVHEVARPAGQATLHDVVVVARRLPS